MPRGKPSPVVAAERALDRPLIEPRVSLYSSSKYVGKVTCFVGEAHASSPTVVVTAMARRDDGWWLRREVANVNALRDRLSDELAAALLPPPLLSAEVEGEYLVVEPYSPLEGWQDRSEAFRVRAHRWLHAFHHATLRGRPEWSHADTGSALATVQSAWRRLRPESTERIVERTRAALVHLHGSPVLRCAIHGDFSPCNLAQLDGQLKVFDWEWASMDALPFIDLWAYQLSELEWWLANEGRAGSDDLLRRACGLIEIELEQRGIDPAFAFATLPVVLAEFVMRFRRTLGRPGTWESSGRQLMPVLERLICG
jgi:hypothetical protein